MFMNDVITLNCISIIFSAIYTIIAVLIFVATLYDLIYLQYKPKSEHGPMSKNNSNVLFERHFIFNNNT